MLTVRDGVRLHYEREGDGPAIVMLHSVGMSGWIWRPLVERWAGRARMLTVDFRGHGMSEVPIAAFSLEDLADDVAEVIDQDGAAPAVVVGLSLGGMVAQVLAARHPQVVSALVLADTNHSMTPQRAQGLEQRAQVAETQGMQATIDSTIARWFTPDFIDGRRDIVEQVRQMLADDDPQANAWSWRAIAGLGDGSLLQRVGVPSLVIVGREDVSTPPAVGRELASMLPRGRYHEIPNAAHMSVMEQPDAFAAAVESFLTEELGWRV